MKAFLLLLSLITFDIWAGDRTYTLADLNNAKCDGACSAHNGEYDGGFWIPDTLQPLQCYCYDRKNLTDLTHKMIGLPKKSKDYHSNAVKRESVDENIPSRY